MEKHTQAATQAKKLPKDAELLLRCGVWLLLAGLAALLLIQFGFGGIHNHGPRTSTGWLLLVVAMACLPLGAMAALLGGAKWGGAKWSGSRNR